jgi:nucleotide-binding universal stress UspA family protein
MLNITKILCPMDFSEYSARALEYASSLAEHYESRLYVQHVIPELATVYPYFPSHGMVTADFDRSVRCDAEERLQEAVRDRAPNGLKAETAVSEGVVSDAILSFGETHKVDLIVMGTHGRRGLDHLMMGSVTERVLRRSNCPVLAVRRPAHDFVDPKGSGDPVHIHKVLYCTDFSGPAKHALPYALSLAEEYEAELTLLHVIESEPKGFAPGLIPQATIDDLCRALKAQVPTDALAWCSVNPLVRTGRPYQQISQVAAEQQTDLVVVGVRGRGAADLALFGSTTHRVIQMGPSPVLVVHNP